MQRVTLEIFQTFGTCVTCLSCVTFSGYEKLQVETCLIPPEETKLIEGTGKWICCFFIGSNFVDISISVSCGYCFVSAIVPTLNI